MNKLYAIDGKYFYAGILVNTGTIILTAPVLKWCESHDFESFREYCKKKRWAIIDCETHPNAFKED